MLLWHHGVQTGTVISTFLPAVWYHLQLMVAMVMLTAERCSGQAVLLIETKLRGITHKSRLLFLHLTEWERRREDSAPRTVHSWERDVSGEQSKLRKVPRSVSAGETARLTLQPTRPDGGHAHALRLTAEVCSLRELLCFKDHTRVWKVWMMRTPKMYVRRFPQWAYHVERWKQSPYIECCSCG